MDKSTIIELAEQEVFDANQYDSNPSERGFTSLFSNVVPLRIKDIQTAISYYTPLSEDKIEQRYSIHFWEECAIGVYDRLFGDLSEYLFRSIDEQELARREISNVDLFLNEGKCFLLQSPEFQCFEQITPMYEKLITGTWPDFFIAEELEAFELSYQENSQITERSLAELMSKYKGKEMHMPTFIEWVEATQNRGLKYTDYFNLHWVAAMEVQALIWYKVALTNISKNGRPCFDPKIEVNSPTENRVKNITMKTLRRSNGGYEAITLSFTAFVHEFSRKPQYGELMLFMMEFPPDGFIVSGKKSGKKVSELTIEGLDNSIDRGAFRKRFDRYFRNMDNKQDIS